MAILKRVSERRFGKHIVAFRAGSLHKPPPRDERCKNATRVSGVETEVASDRFPHHIGVGGCGGIRIRTGRAEARRGACIWCSNGERSLGEFPCC